MADAAPQPGAQQYRERAQLLRAAVENMRTAEGRRSFLDIAQECERHCQVEALQRRLGATGLGLMPRWSRCAIALPLLIGRCEASSGRRDGAAG